MVPNGFYSDFICNAGEHSWSPLGITESIYVQEMLSLLFSGCKEQICAQPVCASKSARGTESPGSESHSENSLEEKCGHLGNFTHFLNR